MRVVPWAQEAVVVEMRDARNMERGVADFMVDAVDGKYSEIIQLEPGNPKV